MISIREITAKETHQIRKVILRDNREDLSVHFKGDLDLNTFHLGLFKNMELIAIASFMKSQNNHFQGTQFQLRGMALVKEAQGKGYGKILLEKGLSRLIKLKTDLVWCNARTTAVNFYIQQGFTTFEKEFMIPDAGPHYVMFKKLKP